MKRILLLCLTAVLVLVNTETWAQERTISGKVTSNEDGSPLPGVNVVLKGTTTGSVTDVDGVYRLSVPSDGGTLVFTFIGLKSIEVAIGERTTLDVQMESDVTQLSEVIVTAQGIEKSKNELAYAAQKIEGDAVSQTRGNNFVNALSGRVAGLSISKNNNMGGSTNVVIRGNKSLTGNNQALFIIDGVPVDNSNTNGGGQQTGRGGYDYGNAAADINPDDIASINVLKGAAATALYGSRAANGVIFITTKKGRGNKGIGVTVNAGVTVGSIDKSTFVEYQKEYGAGYGAYYEDPTGFFLYRDVDGDGTDDLVTPVSEDASWGAPFDPNLMVYQWDAFDPASPNFGRARPWVAAKNGPSTFFETPVATNYSFLVDGSGDKGYYKLGYTRNNENGILPNSFVDKDFLNFSASYKLIPKLTATASVNVSNVSGKGRYGTGYDDKNLMTNFRQWWQTNVDIKEQREAYMRNRQNVTWNWADPTDLVPIYWDNPYFTRFENYQNDNRLRYFGYTMLDYKATEWLNFMGRVSLDSYNEFQEERQAVGSVTVPYYSRFNRSFREYNYDLMASIKKDLSEDLKMTANIGSNIRRTKVESIYAVTNGGLVVPGLYALSNSANPINAPSEQFSLLGVDGYFAGASLNYRDLVNFDLSGRRDISSSLPKGNNAYNYYAVGMNFNFIELMANSQILSGGKVRINYAEVGNTANPNSTKDVYDKPSPFGTTPLFSIPGTKNNPELKPERSKEIEAGLEMAFLQDRVGFDLTYYNRKTVDQIIPIPISRSTGYNSKFVNAGEVVNKGIEVTLFATPVKTNDFSWRVDVNWTRNRNEVVALAEGIDNLQLGAFQGGVSINAALGQPYGTIRGTNFVYTNGQKTVYTTPASLAGSYQPSATSNEVIGNINPDWIGGINNTLKFKDVTLSFLIDMKQGGDLFSLDLYYGMATGLYPETAGLNDQGNPVRSPVGDGGGVILPGVKADGTPNDIRYDATNFGIYGYRRNPAAGFVYDASFVKLREVTLTYSLPQLLVEKLGPVKGIDLSVIGRNLWIIHKNLPYADPEDGISAGNLAQGYQVGSYPNVRNVGFNAKFRF